MKPYDIIALGECLVDFICTPKDGKLFMEGNPGGAPANVLAIASRLGANTAMISKVGADAFGAFLRRHVSEVGIDVDYIMVDSQHPTTLAIVQLDHGGNRSFDFYRDRTADVMLCKEDLPQEALRNTRILHFGSLSLTTEPARSATFEAVRIAKEAGALISYDPNLRKPLWADIKQAKHMLQKGMECADLVKISEEEVAFLTGETDAKVGARLLCKTYQVQLLAVTCGPKGCFYCVEDQMYEAETFDTLCVDTTGAGDASWGAALSWLLEQNTEVRSLTPQQLHHMMDVANAAGSLATTKMGAIPAMPTREEIMECIRTVPRLHIGK